MSNTNKPESSLPAFPDNVVQAVKDFKGKQLQTLAWKYLQTDFSKLRTVKDFDQAESGFGALVLILSKDFGEMIPGLRLHWEVLKHRGRRAERWERKQDLVTRVLQFVGPKAENRAKVKALLETIIKEGR